MKNNIPGYKDNMSIKVIEFITFDSTRVAKKNTFSCPWWKFVSGMNNGRGKTQVAKDFEMTQGAYEIRAQKVFYHVAREKEAYWWGMQQSKHYHPERTRELGIESVKP